MTRKGHRILVCKVCGDPAQRALCSKCSPNRRTTEHQDKYADFREPLEPAPPLGGGFTFPSAPEGMFDIPKRPDRMS